MSYLWPRNGAEDACVYSTLTILTCPICLTTPEPEPITESETFAFRERVDARLDVNRVACGRLWR